MATLKGTVKLRADLVYEGTADEGTVKQEIAAAFFTHKIAAGTDDGEADMLFIDTRPLGAGANEELDLAGVLTGALGNTLTFVDVVGLVISTPDTNVGNIEVGGAASNAFAAIFGDATDKIKIPKNSCVAFMSKSTGWAVAAGTGDKLKVTNADGSNAASYTIRIYGRSA